MSFCSTCSLSNGLYPLHVLNFITRILVSVLGYQNMALKPMRYANFTVSLELHEWRYTDTILQQKVNLMEFSFYEQTVCASTSRHPLQPNTGRTA